MTKRELERTLQPSVLDRLTDVDPRRPADAQVSYAESLTAFKAAVQRDLEWLLNTRRAAATIAVDEFEELRKSLYQFGMPDISSMSGDSNSTRQELLLEVEETLAIFEPRLEQVRISIVEVDGELHRRELRFVLEATLRLDPTPEHVTFDTVLHFASGEINVSGARNA